MALRTKNPNRQKTEAVRGAIRGGFINVLITDIDCAEQLL